jgi:hypothetical protein
VADSCSLFGHLVIWLLLTRVVVMGQNIHPYFLLVPGTISVLTSRERESDSMLSVSLSAVCLSILLYVCLSLSLCLSVSRSLGLLLV